jgi:hypothetical protein
MLLRRRVKALRSLKMRSWLAMQADSLLVA